LARRGHHSTLPYAKNGQVGSGWVGPREGFLRDQAVDRRAPWP